MALLGLAGALAPGGAAQPALRTYDTPYYVLHTDLDADSVREVIRHITLMAEEYYARTRGFAGSVDERLPIYVFRRTEDYYAAGGLRGSAGVFTGRRLMAVAGEALTPQTWHIIQHEGFHQFAAAALGRGLPPWVNEGLAEYFGEGVFTGDAFYVGFIPPARLARVKRGIRSGAFRPLAELMQVDQDIWNTELKFAHHQAGNNYDEAWAMVHFLAEAHDGRYQDAFCDFLRSVSRGQPWERAWLRAFGNDLGAFQQRWEEYWLGLPADPTADLYAEATVATVTSFYARALSQRQRFDSFADFTAAAEAGTLKAHEEDWLPPRLLSSALAKAPKLGSWSLRRRGRPAVLCERPDGTLMQGVFRLANRRVKSVEVIVKRPRKRK